MNQPPRTAGIAPCNFKITDFTISKVVALPLLFRRKLPDRQLDAEALVALIIIGEVHVVAVPVPH